MAVDATPTTERLEEYARSASKSIRVDRENGVLHGVRVLGLKSKNDGGKREYTQECVSQAKPLYEGLVGYADHGKPGASRSIRDRLGIHRNIRDADSGDPGLVSDFHLNPEHEMYKSVLWEAEQPDSSVGFSHSADGRVTRKDGRIIVEKIVSVSSCDIVDRPATVKGFWEGEEIPSDPAQKQLAEHCLSAMSDARCIALGEESVELKTSRLQEVLARWAQDLGVATTVTHKESLVELKEATLDQLKAERPDLVAILTGNDATSKLTAKVTELAEQLAAKDTELAAANAKLVEADQDKAKQAKALAISEELKAAKLTDKDTEGFMEAINAAPDEASRKKLIESIATLAKGRTITESAPFAAIVDKHTETNKGSLASRLR